MKVSNTVVQIIGLVADFVTIIAFAFTDLDIWLKIVAIIFMLISASGFIFLLLKNRFIRVCKNNKQIHTFMSDWISTPGVVKIMSRDLSWVDDDILDIFAEKGKDLLVFAESESDTVKKIRKINPDCRIIIYGKYGFSLGTRYTIIHANKDSRQIAITLASEIDSKMKIRHEVYVSKSDEKVDKKLIGLAMDLMNYMESVEQRNRLEDNSEKNC